MAAHIEWHIDEAWTKVVLSTAVDAIVMIDEQGIMLYANPAAERMFGWSAAELAGQNVNMLMPREEARQHDTYIENYHKTGRRKIIGIGREVVGQHRNGQRIAVHLSVSEAQIDSRRVYMGILRDLTREKENQAEKDRLLQELSYRNRQLASLYAVGTALAENAAPSAALAAAARHMENALSHSDVVRVRILLDGEVVAGPAGEHECACEFEAPIVVSGSKRGVFHVCYESKPLAWDDPAFQSLERELIELIARRLSESLARRYAEAQILQASKLASIGELAAGVSHEINNPINGIINCADILLGSIPEDHEDYEFIQLIRSESERIATIVRNLLTFSRHDKDEHSLARLYDIVEATLSLTRKRVERSRIELAVDIPESLPRVRCRSEQLQQVLMNLMMNAIHALDQRYPGAHPEKRLALHGRFDGTANPECVLLEVRDTGTGILPEHMDRLFDPFFTTKGRDQGTGLGLSISRGIVEQHGGKLLVESELGRGSTFTVVLPLQPGWRTAGEEPESV